MDPPGVQHNDMTHIQKRHLYLLGFALGFKYELQNATKVQQEANWRCVGAWNKGESLTLLRLEITILI